MTHDDLRMTAAVERGRTLTILVDGHQLAAYEGRASRGTGRVRTPVHALDGAHRGAGGYFCGMGVCQDCLVTVDGLPNVRACMTPVRDGLRVETQRGLGDWE